MLATIDTGSGHPVLLLHGQPGSKTSWAPLIDSLAADFRVLAPDRPGYGDSEGEATGMAANADVMAEFLRSRGAAPATVVGHSWSGGVAVLLALRHPDTVRSLVLVGAVGTRDSVNRLDRLMVVPGIGDLLTVAALTGIGVILPWIRVGLSRIGRKPPASPSRVGKAGLNPGGGDIPAAASKLRAYLAAALPNEKMPGGWRGAWGRDRRTFLHEQRALLAELPSVTAALTQVRVPTSVVAGMWDVVVPPRAARSLTAAIPGAELVAIPDTGHFVARDASPLLAKVIVETDRRAGSA
ncbi:MAG TPA: alpha/beta hydrolase [Acidimicrobiales bacterium]|nr:alpha/beta hydrolase [Acidimicrobiales bacterium]